MSAKDDKKLCERLRDKSVRRGAFLYHLLFPACDAAADRIEELLKENQGFQVKAGQLSDKIDNEMWRMR